MDKGLLKVIGSGIVGGIAGIVLSEGVLQISENFDKNLISNIISSYPNYLRVASFLLGSGIGASSEMSRQIYNVFSNKMDRDY